MAVQSTDPDVQTLHHLGYAQELLRRMSGFSNFAVSFTIISILSGCLTLFAFGMRTGGPAEMTLGWLVVGGFVTLVALGMAGASLKPLTAIINDIQGSAAAAERIDALLKAHPEPGHGSNLPRLSRHSESMRKRTMLPPSSLSYR